MARRDSPLRVAVAGTAVMLGSLAVPIVTGRADASTSTAGVAGGLADVNTDLGYENAAAAGTGMVLSADSDVVTNNHVIRGATTIKVRDVGNGKTYGASVLGYDVPADVAVLKLKDASELRRVSIAVSSSVKVGASVTAIGNAGGTGGTPTSATGVVVALDQSITASDELTGTSEELSGLIETNASIAPGDSGGALVNSTGQVIGMTTAASSGFEFEPGGSEGFAIPITSVISIAQQIEAGHFAGNVHRAATAFLGVGIYPSSGYFSGGVFLSGALVENVVPASPAEKAGLTPGDVITSVEGHSIVSPATLTDALLPLAPGARVKVQWVDQEGVAHAAMITLASGPPQ